MDKPFISSVELAELLGIKQREASHIIACVNKQLADKGMYVVKSKPAIAPYNLVKEFLSIK